MYKLVVGLIMISVVILSTTEAHALSGVGGEQLCLINDTVGPPLVNYSLDSNDLYGQTFTAPTSFNLSAVKWNVFNRGTNTGTFLNIHLVNTSSSAPDMNSIIATETIEVDTLPMWDAGTPANMALSCDPDVRSSQVTIFDPAPALVSGTLYAVVVEWNSGPSTSPIASMPAAQFDDFYAGGHLFDCAVPGACARLTPATWDLSNGVVDGGMVLFDDIIQVGDTGIDLTLNNFLQSSGLNSLMGRLFFGSLIVGGFMLFMLWRGTPFLFTLMAGGMISLAGISSNLISESILLTAFAIVGVALIFVVIYGFQSRKGEQNE